MRALNVTKYSVSYGQSTGYYYHRVLTTDEGYAQIIHIGLRNMMPITKKLESKMISGVKRLRMAVVGKMFRVTNIVGQYRSILLNR